MPSALEYVHQLLFELFAGLFFGHFVLHINKGRVDDQFGDFVHLFADLGFENRFHLLFEKFVMRAFREAEKFFGFTLAAAYASGAAA